MCILKIKCFITLQDNEYCYYFHYFIVFLWENMTFFFFTVIFLIGIYKYKAYFNVILFLWSNITDLMSCNR